MLSTTLRDETRRLLRDRPRRLSLRVIAQDTGLNLRWLQDFSTGVSDHPSVVYVQTLYEYLSGKKLLEDKT